MSPKPAALVLALITAATPVFAQTAPWDWHLTYPDEISQPSKSVDYAPAPRCSQLETAAGVTGETCGTLDAGTIIIRLDKDDR